MEMEQSVPKRRNIKFRRRGITQKKEYNVQNMAKAWNQGRLELLNARQLLSEGMSLVDIPNAMSFVFLTFWRRNNFFFKF